MPNNKTATIHIRCDPHFKQELASKAAQNGMSLSRYIRYLAENDLHRDSAPPVTNLEQVVKLNLHLQRMGNNLNQLMAHINTYKDVSPESVKTWAALTNDAARTVPILKYIIRKWRRRSDH